MFYVLLAVIAGAILSWQAYRWRIVARRERLARQPLRADWRAMLEERVPLYAKLPADLKHRLDGDINVFLAEKQFYGQGGLEVTDTMRLTIAAQACLLTVNQPVRHYPEFTSIILYPDTYVTEEIRRDGWLETTREATRAGESWDRGPVILSWADTAGDTDNPADGCNVALHEFAHKLDEQEGGMDGAPALEHAQYASWASVFRREFAILQARTDEGLHSVLDEYGATSPAEFFAVATETFFERPQELRTGHPDLYRELEQFYRLDPAAW